MTAVPVPAELAPWIAAITVDSFSGGTMLHPPDHCPTLVYRGGDVLVVGPRTHATYHPGKDIPCCIRLRVRAGAATVLFGAAAELVDDVHDIGALWGIRGDRLRRQLAEIQDPGQLIGRITAALRERISTQRQRELDRAGLVRAAIGRLGSVKVGDTANGLGVSERTLRAVFTETVGISPRHFAGINRVRTVLSLTGKQSLANTALTAGFYDQSHMTADFRKFMHVTPAEFAAGRLPAPQPC